VLRALLHRGWLVDRLLVVLHGGSPCGARMPALPEEDVAINVPQTGPARWRASLYTGGGPVAPSGGIPASRAHCGRILCPPP
jgi:hypothetical protein